VRISLLFKGTSRAVPDKRIGSDDWLAYINGNTKRHAFLPECEGFFIEQCSCFPNGDFLRVLRQGTRVCACSA
jgi:hypothetical protein